MEEEKKFTMPAAALTALKNRQIYVDSHYAPKKAPRKRRGIPVRPTLTKSAKERLMELGFDPIKRMLDVYDQTDREIYFLLHDDVTGLRKEKFSMVGLAALLAVKQKCVNDLLRYGYKRELEAVLPENKVAMGLNIHTTTEGSFKRITEELGKKESTEDE